MKPLKKQRLSDMVVDSIKKMIKDRNLKAGDKLPSEHEMMKDLQVSRSSIREAVRILEVTGVLSVKQGKGIFVADKILEEFFGMNKWLEENRDSLFEHFEIRLMIEPHVCELAAKKCDSKMFELMTQTFDGFLDCYERNDMQGMIKFDAKMHHLIAKCTKNRTLEIIMKTMADILTEGWITSLHTPGRVESTIKEHRAVLDAIGKGDSVAAGEAMKVHLSNALNDIKEYYRKHPEEK